MKRQPHVAMFQTSMKMAKKSVEMTMLYVSDLDKLDSSSRLMNAVESYLYRSGNLLRSVEAGNINRRVISLAGSTRDVTW